MILLLTEDKIRKADLSRQGSGVVLQVEGQHPGDMGAGHGGA